ncbi:MAG TPA: M42 family peptidase [Clostridia bacterium]|nr:M42 family peptidase [Clostridia bacterium]
MNLERMIDLSNCFGPAGFEEEVARLIKKSYKGSKKLTSDTLNNVYIGLEEKKGLRVQLDAHLDEVGFMVSRVFENGMLGLHPLGGWVEYNLPSQSFLIRSKSGEFIPGIVASKPPHFLSEKERNTHLALEDMVVDVGATSAREIAGLGIGIGSPMVPQVSCQKFIERDLLLGKAFDCRLGVAALLDVVEVLEKEEVDLEIIGALSSQEEGGLRGAQVTARQVEADLAIVFEGCPADDSFLSPPQSQTGIHKGPMLRHVDRGMLTHPGFQNFALEIAKSKMIPHQEAVRSGGSTNGSPIHLSHKGIPTIVLGIPVRYIHSHFGYASLRDYQATVELALEIIRGINKEVYDSFKPF